MNHDEPARPDPIPCGYGEVDALIDGEAVDKEALRFALDDRDARDYLIDALLLRQMARDSGPRHFVAPAARHNGVVRGLRWLAASTLTIAGAAAGYAYGQHAGSPGTALAGQSVEVAVFDAPQPAAPQPTQIIRFQPGINWTTENRGQ